MQIHQWYKAQGDFFGSLCPAGIWDSEPVPVCPGITGHFTAPASDSAPTPWFQHPLVIWPWSPSGDRDWPSFPGACGFTKEVVTQAKQNSNDRGEATGPGHRQSRQLMFVDESDPQCPVPSLHRTWGFRLASCWGGQHPLGNGARYEEWRKPMFWAAWVGRPAAGLSESRSRLSSLVHGYWSAPLLSAFLGQL